MAPVFKFSRYTTPNNNPALSVDDMAWSPSLGLFCIAAGTSVSDSMITSPDGQTWTRRTSANTNLWEAVAWSPTLGLFAALANSGTGNRAQTSGDGINWTIRTTPLDLNWLNICWGNGVFVATSNSGTTQRVMTSTDGITWTARTTPNQNFRGVVWGSGPGLFVAVAQSGTGNRVMTSPDGTTWTSRTSAQDNNWLRVAYSPTIGATGLYVAVASNGTNRVMTSPDGINWTARTASAVQGWESIIWSPEWSLFVALAFNGTVGMTSPDGITWTSFTIPGTAMDWLAIAYSPSLKRVVAAAQAITDNVLTMEYDAPQVTSNAATAITKDTATANATVNPNGEAVTDYHFEYGTDSGLAGASTTTPGSLSADLSDHAVSAGLTGLTPLTTYYFRIVATSSQGTSYGSILNFATIAAPPTVTSDAANSIAQTTATVNATINPNGVSVTDYHFEYGTDSGLAGANTTTPGSLGADSSNHAVSAGLTSLTPSTRYYFRIVATNSGGTSYGSILYFDTLSIPVPTVTSNAASSITKNSATLNAIVNPNGLAISDYHFEYGTDPGLAGANTTTPGTLGADSSDHAVSAGISSLTPSTRYYFRIVATNSSGTSYGSILYFDTSARLAPTATTDAATSVGNTGATVNATINPNDEDITDYHFEYGTDPALAGASTTTPGTIGADSSNHPVNAPLTGLSPLTTYYFRIKAISLGGTSYGSILSFATSALPPVVTTNAATLISDDTTTVNATINPNGAAITDYHFEYGTDPGLAGASTTTPGTIGSDLIDHDVSANLLSLTPSTTYYFRIKATSSAGTSTGSILTFDTTATPPPPPAPNIDLVVSGIRQNTISWSV